MNWRRSLTTTVVAITGLFTVCQLPPFSLRISVLLGQLPDVVLNDQLLLQASNITSGLLIVNATANFFIYCVVGTSFRRGLFQLLYCRRPVTSSPPLVEKKCKVELASIQNVLE